MLGGKSSDYPIKIRDAQGGNEKKKQWYSPLKMDIFFGKMWVWSLCGGQDRDRSHIF